MNYFTLHSTFASVSFVFALMVAGQQPLATFTDRTNSDSGLDIIKLDEALYALNYVKLGCGSINSGQIKISFFFFQNGEKWPTKELQPTAWLHLPLGDDAFVLEGFDSLTLTIQY